MQPSTAGDGRPAAEPQVRASDGDRDWAVERLNAAFAEGRLTQSERDERVHSAYAARTWPQLRELTDDLPGSGLAVSGAGSRAADPAAGMPADLEHLLICALLCLCPPVGIWLLIMSRRRARVQQGQPPADEAIAPAQEAPYQVHSGPYGS